VAIVDSRSRRVFHVGAGQFGLAGYFPSGHVHILDKACVPIEEPIPLNMAESLLVGIGPGGAAATKGPDSSEAPSFVEVDICP
jgi:hypothetical protein